MVTIKNIIIFFSNNSLKKSLKIFQKSIDRFKIILYNLKCKLNKASATSAGRTKDMEKTNYIVRGTGYIALLAAVIEQARIDAKKGDTDAELGIEEWADIAAADTNFKIYE